MACSAYIPLNPLQILLESTLKRYPLEDENLLDPAHTHLDAVSRSQKLHDLQSISVAKSMLSQDFITQAQFDAILVYTLAARDAQTPAPTASAAECKARKKVCVEYLFNLKYLDPTSAMTVASVPAPDLRATSDTAHVNVAVDEMKDC
ncbi:hypothetical protein MBANPS3_011829 [Mucor bainieri]